MDIAAGRAWSFVLKRKNWLIVGRMQKQSKCLLKMNGSNVACHSMEYCSALKKKEFLVLALTRRNFEDSMLSQISQSQNVDVVCCIYVR